MELEQRVAQLEQAFVGETLATNMALGRLIAASPVAAKRLLAMDPQVFEEQLQARALSDVALAAARKQLEGIQAAIRNAQRK